jgi:uncharacterized protein involved in exopolysaccharide biosynthesis
MEAPEPARVSLRDFLNVIFKRKFQILLFFFVTFSTVAFATLLARPTYQTAAQILVKVGRENIYVPETAGSNPVVSINREEQINSEIEILKSPSLVKEVMAAVGPAVIYPELSARKPGILASIIPAGRPEAQPVDKAMLALQKQLDVEGIKKSNIIEVSFKHHDPQMAAFVVNTLAKLYLDRHVQVYKTPHSYEFFQQQAELLKKKLTAAEDRLKALKEQYNITVLADQQKILFQRTQDARMALNQTLNDKVEVKNRIQLQQEVDVDRQNYRLYLTKFEESRISDAMDSQKITSVSLVEPAQVPLKPVSPKVLLNLVLGVFLGALGGLGLAFFLHYLDDGLENVEDAEDALDVPVLFCIPYDKKEEA